MTRPAFYSRIQREHVFNIIIFQDIGNRALVLTLSTKATKYKYDPEGQMSKS